MVKKEASDEKTRNSTAEKKKCALAVRIVGGAAVVLLILYFAAKSLLATPYAAGLASDYLSAALQQRITVTAISLSGLTVSVRGVVIANPAGFPGGPLASARSLRMKPDISGILAGKRSFTLLRAEGLKIILGKNQAGEWNYTGLAHYLTRKKKGPAKEFFVGDLVLKDVSLKAGEFSLEKISLTLHDLSTKGMADSKLVFTGTDGKGSPFRVAAEGRLGKDPDVRLTIAAPDFSLGTLGNVPKGKPVFSLENGTASLFLSARYRSGDLSANGHAACDRLGIIVKGQKKPLRGVFDFAARYSALRDEGKLERGSLVVNNKARLDVSGYMRHVKKERDFRIAAFSNEIPLKELLTFLPEKTVGDMAVNGMVTFRDFQLGGSGRVGITSGGGRISLRNAEVLKNGRSLLRGLSSDIKISRTGGGWDIGGTFAMSAHAGKIPLDNLNALFISRFSSTFKLLSVEVPVLKADIRGIPVHGQLTYSPKGPGPYRGTLFAKSAPLSAFNDLVDAKKLGFSSGAADISLQASGRGPASFVGEMSARLSGVTGTVSGKDFALRDGEITSRFSRAGGKFSAAGTTGLDGGVYSGSNFSGTFAYSLTGGRFSLTGGKTVFNRTSVKFADISGRMPVREPVSAGARYPLNFTASGLVVESGQMRISDLSGSVEGFLVSDAKGRRLEGNAVLNVPAISLRGRPVGSVKALVALAGDGAVAKMNGTALDGELASIAKFDPLSLKKGVSFNGTVRDAPAARLSEILPERFALRFPAGKITANLEGNWSAGKGLGCGIEGSGSDLTFVAKGGKTLVTGAGLVLRGDVAGSNFSVKEATIRKGQVVALNISGSMTNTASPSREGKFSLELEKGAVNTIFDNLANLLPKPLQQANGSGKLGMRGILAFGGGKILLEGTMQCDNVLLDFPSSKVNIAGITGVLPFSLYLSGGMVEKPVYAMSFSRENYPMLLDTLRREVKNGKKGEVLEIGKVQFGPLEIGDIRVYAKSGNGTVEISYIDSTLYSGKVIGKGFLFYHGGLNYETDLLINDMSLKQFCSSYPALKGYISGKLDGVVSLYGGKGGLPAMIGFVDLWARKGKDEKMLVSKEFLQRLAGRKLKGFFFQDDRPYDNGEISAFLQNGYLTFEKLDLSHKNFLGMKDLSVSVAPVQNMIGLDHLFQTIREAAKRGKPAAGAPPAEAPVPPDVKWLE